MGRFLIGILRISSFKFHFDQNASQPPWINTDIHRVICVNKKQNAALESESVLAVIIRGKKG